MGHYKPLLQAIRFCIVCMVVVLLLLSSVLFALVHPELLSDDTGMTQYVPMNSTISGVNELPSNPWVPPDTSSIPETQDGRLIRYGYELVSHTSRYLGPKGSVSTTSNGMNCQNCHLDAGARPFGNNYSAVASTYPKFRARSGSVETYEKRVNDCIERSLNGKPLDNDSREMSAFVVYITWVGHLVPKDSVPKGSGIATPAFLSRPADSSRGKLVYEIYCTRCHGKNGEGMMAEDGLEWKYPPLFGDQSYNTGAGLFRLSRFAGFVKANMPYDIVTLSGPILSDEEAWDVAAYVNSQPRPAKTFSQDWPDISKKPFDHPFGPYADNYTEAQHKYGPYNGMVRKN